MDSMLQYWPYIVVVLAIAIVIALLLLRPRQRVRLTDSAPVRPHMVGAPREGRGLDGRAARREERRGGEHQESWSERRGLAFVHSRSMSELAELKFGPTSVAALNPEP